MKAGMLKWGGFFPGVNLAFPRFIRPIEMLATFSELAVKDPDLMRLVLQTSIAALVNAQTVEAIDAELNRRAVVGN